MSERTYDEDYDAPITFRDVERTARTDLCSELFSGGTNIIYLSPSDKVLRSLCSMIREEPSLDSDAMISRAKKIPNLGVLNSELLFKALKYFYSSPETGIRELTPSEFKKYCEDLKMEPEQKIDFLRYLYYVALF